MNPTNDSDNNASTETDSTDVANNQQQEVVEEELDASSDNNDQPIEAATSSNRSVPWLLILVILLIVAALVGSGLAQWWQYQQFQQHKEVTDQLSGQVQDQSNSVNQVGERIENDLRDLQRSVRQQLEAAAAQTRQQQEQQSVLQQQLEAQNQRLLKLSSVNSQNWELAEALYLTRLAGQRLAMEQNREAALALLEGAEAIIARQQSPELLNVRDVIINDITALKIVEAVDKEGLFLQLSAIHRQLYNLPITESLNYQSTLQDIPVATDNNEQGWWNNIVNNIKNSFQEIDGYVRKIDLEAPPIPLLTVEDQQTIRLSASLYIESAQIALLRGQTTVFNNALGQASLIISTYYPESNQRAELMLALEELQSQNIQPNLPDISASYTQLSQFIQNNNGQSTTEETP